MFGSTCMDLHVQYMKCTHMIYQSYIITQSRAMDTYQAPYVKVALKHDQEHVTTSSHVKYMQCFMSVLGYQVSVPVFICYVNI